MASSGDEPPALDIPSGWLNPSAPPLILDIGCHRGSFLLALAAQNPPFNILGIEKQSARVGRALRKIQNQGIPNAWAAQSGGLEALKRLPLAAIAGIHVLFPDPWPKRRHAPRRMVDGSFLAEAARVLVPGGFLRFVTDDEPYAEAVRHLAEGLPAFQPREWEPSLFPVSAFEETFRTLGKPIHRLGWTRITP